MAKAFISHASKDRALVEERIVRPLRELGIEAWLAPDGIRPGSGYPEKIRQEIEQCDWFVLAMTPSAAESDHVKGELVLARERRPPNVIPVLLDKSCKPADFHYVLGHIQMLDLTDGADAKCEFRKLPDSAPRAAGAPAPAVHRIALEWFPSRLDSTASMYDEMRRQKHLVFLGVSQERLVEHLKMVLEEALGKSANVPLPWTTIDIHFAPEHVGRSMEGNQNIDQKIRKSRQDVVDLLTKPKWEKQLSSLQQITFWETPEAPLAYGGSMFGSTLCSDGLPDFSVAHVVNYLPEENPDAKTALTFKIATSEHDDEAKWLLNRYRTAYAAMKTNGHQIGQFMRQSIWDVSAEPWAEFCKQCRPHQQSTKTLVALARRKGTNDVLDLAAGSGDASSELLAQNSKIKLTVLDASPRMLYHMRRRFKDKPNVSFAIDRVPAKGSLDLRGREFQTIVSHFGLSELEASSQGLLAFAKWVNRHLKLKGCIYLAAHNGAIDLSDVCPPPPSDPWRDILRDKAEPYKLQAKPQPALPKPADIVRAFELAGFSPDPVPVFSQPLASPPSIDYVLHSKTCSTAPVIVQPFSWEDRQALWRIPAVFSTLFDLTDYVRNHPAEEVRALVKSVVDRASSRIDSSQPPPQRAVIYLAFQKIVGVPPSSPR